MTGQVQGAEPFLRIIDAKRHFLGALGAREWQSFERERPEGRSFEVKFTAAANEKEATLFIRQKDVKLNWPVKMNGANLGRLDLYEGDVVSRFTIPPGALKEGENVLAISSPGAPDDVVLGEIRLDTRPSEQALHEVTVSVKVTEAGSGEPLPCRLTIVDEEGALMPVLSLNAAATATRTGVVYTADGRAELGLPAGRFTLHATRGFEYGLSTQKLDLSPGESKVVSMHLKREVPTPNLIACDTHVHSLTFSGHGDATDAERAITLAGEGIELPIATDHNRYADYAPAAQRTGVQSRFTPVLGIEVTTPTGHFNAFPVAAVDAPLPNHKLTEWPELMASIRAVPAMQVIILNHPRDTHNKFIPFSQDHFNPVTGDNLRGADFSFDAVEVANSGAMQSDFMQSYRDWFALLNHGYKVTAVGSSDCHDVSRFIVGQGRSYVVCKDGDPGQLDVNQACRSFKEGRVYVSLGLLTQMTVDERYEAGDLASLRGHEIDVHIRVLGPGWIRADRVELYQNGLKILEERLDSTSDAVEKASVRWKLPIPSHDAHLVAIASGPGITENYWKLAPPYQPSSRILTQRVYGSTNPVWVDADGDGEFAPPRAHAAAVIHRAGTTDAAALLKALKDCDAAVAAQAAALLHLNAAMDLRSAAFTEALIRSSEATQAGFRDYIATMPANK